MYRVVVFGSEFCIPCKYLKREFDKLNVKYTYIDVEKNPSIANEYMVTSIPTTIILDKSNKVIASYVGNSRKIIDEILDILYQKRV